MAGGQETEGTELSPPGSPSLLATQVRRGGPVGSDACGVGCFVANEYRCSTTVALWPLGAPVAAVLEAGQRPVTHDGHTVISGRAW